MKLAFVLFRYFPFGGLQRDCLRIARVALARGHTVHIFTMAWEGPSEPDLQVTLVPTHGLQNHTRILSFAKTLPVVLAPHHFDRVIGFNKLPGLDFYYAADTCFKARIKREHSLLIRLLPRYRTLLTLEKAIFKPTAKTHILLLCEKQKQEFIHWYNTPTKRLFLLPPGIARDRLNTDIPTSRSSENHQVLFIGSGFHTKGLDRAIEALAALPHALRQKTKLTVLGSDTPDVFIHQAKNLHLEKQVEFMGGRFDVPAFLQAADLLIHPARNENTGTVLLEALAAGVPVLTTEVCGYAHYVKKAKAGIVLDAPFRQKALNMALQNMLSSPDPLKLRHSALNFARTADIYSLPEHATDLIESLPL